MLDYKTFLYLYLPVLLLIIIAILRERCEPGNKSLKLQKWSLFPVIIIIGLSISVHILLSLWPVVPLLKKYAFNRFNWNIASLCAQGLNLILIFIILRYYSKNKISEIFNLKISYLPFILKFCGFFTILMILNHLFIYDPEFDDKLFPGHMKEYEIIRAMDMKNFILDSFVGIIIGPIEEELIFRGLLYVPLYRKVGRYGAIVLSSFIWSYVHFQDTLSSIVMFILGLMLAWLYDRRGSLLHPLVFHMFRNGWMLAYKL